MTNRLTNWLLTEGYWLTIDELKRLVPIQPLVVEEEFENEDPTVLGILAPSLDRWDSWHFWIRPAPAYMSIWSDESGEWYFNKGEPSELYLEFCLCKIVDAKVLHERVQEIMREHHNENVARRLLDY